MDNNDDRRPMLWAAIVPFFSLAVIVYAVRISGHWRKSDWRDWRKSNWAWAEVSISITMLANVGTIVLTAVAAWEGFGKHMSAIPETDARITIFFLV